MSNNSQSKSLALMFLLGAFVTGGALGFVAKGAMATNTPVVRPGPSSELARVLGLDQAQEGIESQPAPGDRVRKRGEAPLGGPPGDGVAQLRLPGVEPGEPRARAAAGLVAQVVGGGAEGVDRPRALTGKTWR